MLDLAGRVAFEAADDLAFGQDFLGAFGDAVDGRWCQRNGHGASVDQETGRVQRFSKAASTIQ